MSLKNLLKKIKSPKGFTFIELLIAIAIISIMVSIGAVSFSAAQRQGRDAQRKSDLGKIASALEQYYADNNAYPIDDVSGQISCGGVIPWGDPLFCNNVTYLNELPDDPLSSQDYYYKAFDVSNSGCTGFDCQRFVLSAKLENGGDPAIPLINCTPALSRNYCITNP